MGVSCCKLGVQTSFTVPTHTSPILMNSLSVPNYVIIPGLETVLNITTSTALSSSPTNPACPAPTQHIQLTEWQRKKTRSFYIAWCNL